MQNLPFPYKSMLDELENQTLLLKKLVDFTMQRVSGMEDDYYTVAEVSEILKRSERTIRRWIAEGIIEAYKINGNRYLIKKNTIQRMIGEKIGKFGD